jgi:hypothetical protein
MNRAPYQATSHHHRRLDERELSKMQLRTTTCTALALAAMIAMASSPSRAEAQGGLGDLGGGLVAVGVIVIGIPSVIFAVGDIVSFAGNTPFSPGWAVVETIVAVAVLATGITLLAVGAAEDAGLMVASIPIFALGGLNLGHAIWSFVTHGTTDTYGFHLTPYIAPTDGGFMTGAAATF